jgi:hypothetical protein
MVKRLQLDGEYMALGRQTIETNTVVTPFGSDQATQVNIQGTGLQENEFQDGFRMSVRATQPMTMNVDVKDGIDNSMLAALQGQDPVSKCVVDLEKGRLLMLCDRRLPLFCCHQPGWCEPYLEQTARCGPDAK